MVRVIPAAPTVGVPTSSALAETVNPKKTEAMAHATLADADKNKRLMSSPEIQRYPALAA